VVGHSGADCAIHRLAATVHCFSPSLAPPGLSPGDHVVTTDGLARLDGAPAGFMSQECALVTPGANCSRARSTAPARSSSMTATSRFRGYSSRSRRSRRPPSRAEPASSRTPGARPSSVPRTIRSRSGSSSKHPTRSSPRAGRGPAFGVVWTKLPASGPIWVPAGGKVVSIDARGRRTSAPSATQYV
jgi:hypothetical protein